MTETVFIVTVLGTALALGYLMWLGKSERPDHFYQSPYLNYRPHNGHDPQIPETNIVYDTDLQEFGNPGDSRPSSAASYADRNEQAGRGGLMSMLKNWLYSDSTPTYYDRYSANMHRTPVRYPYIDGALVERPQHQYEEEYTVLEDDSSQPNSEQPNTAQYLNKINNNNEYIFKKMHASSNSQKIKNYRRHRYQSPGRRPSPTTSQIQQNAASLLENAYHKSFGFKLK